MSLIKFDEAGNPIRHNLILAEVDYSPIGNLMVDDLKISLKTDNVIEATFTVHKKYRTDDGDYLDNPYYDKVEGMRLLLIEDLAWFKISSPSLNSDGIDEYKECVALSEETTFSKKTLDTLFINLGTDESAEWIYAREVYPNKTDEQIIDLLSSPTSGIGYVQFYNEDNPRLSLLHMLVNKNPGWTIGYVENRLKKLIRQFKIEGEQDILSTMKNDIQTAYDCIFTFDTLSHEVNVYHKDSIGIDTDIYMSFDTLLQKYNASYDIGDIITSYKVSGSEDFSIREVNGGSDTIINLDFYHTTDWMGKALYKRYGAYKNARKSVEKKYSEIMAEVYVKLDEITDLKNKFFTDYDIDIDTVITEKNSIGSISDITDSNVSGNTTMTTLVDILRSLTDSVIDENISDAQLLRTFFYLYDGDIDNLYYTDINEYEELSKKQNNGSTAMTKSIIKLSVVDKVIAAMGKIYLDTLLTLYKNLYETRCVAQTEVNSKNNETVIDEKKTLLFNKRVTAVIESIESVLVIRNAKIVELENDYNFLIQQSIDLTSPYTFENYFTQTEQQVLSQFIHEGYYDDTGFEITDIMTVQEIFELKQELKNQADTDLLRKSCPQISVSLDVCDIFEIKEFKSLLNQMQLWNYIHAEIRDDYKVKLHLLGMDIDYSSEPSLTLTLGNIYHKTDPIKRQNDLLNQVSTTSSSVSKTSSELSKYKTENKVATTYVNDLIENGLDLALTDIKSTDNQSVEVDNYGIHLRKLLVDDNTTTEDTETDEENKVNAVGSGKEKYDPEQGWIVNNKFLFTDDNWETVKSLYGKFQVPDGTYYEGGEYFGVIAEMIIAGLVQGSLLVGNKIVTEGDVGSVIIDPNNDGTDESKSVTFKNKTVDETGKEIETVLLRFDLETGEFILGKDVKMSWGDGKNDNISSIISYIENNTLQEIEGSITTVNNDLNEFKQSIGYTYQDSQYVISPNIVGGSIIGGYLKIVKKETIDGEEVITNTARITSDGEFISLGANDQTTLSEGKITFDKRVDVYDEKIGDIKKNISTSIIKSTTMSGNGYYYYEDGYDYPQEIYGLELRVPIVDLNSTEKTHGGNYISFALVKQNDLDSENFIYDDRATYNEYNNGSFLLIQGERGIVDFALHTNELNNVSIGDGKQGVHVITRFFCHDEAFLRRAYTGRINSTSIVSGSAVAVSSDYNLKNTINIISIDKSKDLILNLKPVTYKYNNGTSDRLHWGFIAQDVEDILKNNEIDTKDFAGYVYDEETGFRNLRYEEFIAPMVSVIQDQENKINELESDVETLKKKYEELENKLNMLLEKLD